jgi:lanthanide-dependent methanol dehydrogenase
MRVLRKTAYIPVADALMTCASAFGVWANDELINLASDAKNWAMPTGDYANTRYSKLNQVTKDNV